MHIRSNGVFVTDAGFQGDFYISNKMWSNRVERHASYCPSDRAIAPICDKHQSSPQGPGYLSTCQVHCWISLYANAEGHHCTLLIVMVKYRSYILNVWIEGKNAVQQLGPHSLYLVPECCANTLDPLRLHSAHALA